MENYRTETSNADELIQQQGQTWAAINPEYVARMRLQNRFRTGLDIARYTAKIMREDMESYDNDSANYTQSLGCWHGFVGQQKMISIKKHFETTREVITCTCLAGWSRRFVQNSVRCLINPCMRKPQSRC